MCAKKCAESERGLLLEIAGNPAPPGAFFRRSSRPRTPRGAHLPKIFLQNAISSECALYAPDMRGALRGEFIPLHHFHIYGAIRMVISLASSKTTSNGPKVRASLFCLFCNVSNQKVRVYTRAEIFSFISFILFYFSHQIHESHPFFAMCALGKIA